MTTTAHEDQFTVGTQTIEKTVRQPYDTVAILRRNIADMEVALRTQTELKEKAEAELAKLAQQKPVAYVKYKATGGNVGLSWLAVPTGEFYPREGEQLYAAPVPVPHKGATHCGDCGLTWLDDGLNPLGCPYCKVSAPAPAEWRRVIDAALGLLESTTCETGVCMCGDSVIGHADFSVGHSACDSGTYHQLGVIEQLRALLQSAEVRHD